MKDQLTFPPVPVDQLLDRLAAPLAGELGRLLLPGSADDLGAIRPAVAELVREGVARAAERLLRGREFLTIEELAAAFGWSVRRWRAWAREAGLAESVRGHDVYRVEAVRAALEFADGAKSHARQELEKRIAGLETQLARLLDAEKRRQEAERDAATQTRLTALEDAA